MCKPTWQAKAGIGNEGRKGRLGTHNGGREQGSGGRQEWENGKVTMVCMQKTSTPACLLPCLSAHCPSTGRFQPASPAGQLAACLATHTVHACHAAMCCRCLSALSCLRRGSGEEGGKMYEGRGEKARRQDRCMRRGCGKCEGRRIKDEKR